jgi:hypothetical protein
MELVCVTLHWYIEPNFINPATLKLLPNRTKLRTDKLLPACAISKMDNELPKRPKDRRLKLEPRVNALNVESWPLHRISPRTENADPARTNERRLKLEPTSVES